VTAPVVIIGAGPAGLATGACLRQAGIDSVILEKSDRVASAWHRHYERLHLHTDKTRSTLPFAPFPDDYPRYPSRLQVIEYLEEYARRFELAIELDTEVLAAQPQPDGWRIETRDRTTRDTTGELSVEAPSTDAPPGDAPSAGQPKTRESSDLVVATGYNRTPILPSWPGMDEFGGTILHSSEYRNGKPYTDREVLVVGFGNSGGEIAVDLFEHGARPHLAVRSPVNVIPRELFGIPILAVGKLQRLLPPAVADLINAPLLAAVIGDLTPWGLRKLPYGPSTQIREHGRIPLIDVGTIALIKDGSIAVEPGIERFTADGVVFDDDTTERFDAIVLATGYRPRVQDFLQGAEITLDPDGTPRVSGRATELPGLYFCGFYVSPRGMLREIAHEAERISADIAQRRSGSA